MSVRRDTLAAMACEHSTATEDGGCPVQGCDPGSGTSGLPGDYWQLFDIWQEFTDRLNELAVAHAFSVWGLPSQVARLGQFAHTVDPNIEVSVSDETFTNPMASWGKLRLGDAPDFLGGEGAVARLLGQQWVVTVFAVWNDDYRKRLAEALNVKDKTITYPALGDLRLYRNDIVHHRGIAQADKSCKAEVLHWAEEDAPIVIGEDQVREFMAQMGLVTYTRIKGLPKMVGSGVAIPTSAAVGRNDSCPCGSGRKYKKCHGR